MLVANSIKKQLFLALSIISLNVPWSIHAAQPADHKLEIQQTFEQLLRQHLVTSRAIDLVLQDILLLVTNNAIKIQDKATFIANVQNLKEFISDIANEAFVHIDPHSLEMLGLINKVIMQHIIAALNKHLVAFPPFDLEKIITKHKPRIDLSMEDLHTDIKKNDATLSKLQAKTKVAGLRWYNKAYRVFDNYVIQPSAKYKLPLRGGLVLGGGFLGFQALLRLDSFQNQWFRNTFGWYPHYEGGGNKLDTEFHNGYGKMPEHPIKWPGNFNKFFIEVTRGFAPIDMFVYASLAAYIISERTALINYVTRKCAKLHNNLKGGTYSDKAEVKFSVNPRVRFDDLVGLHHAKETLSFIVNYLEDPERFDRPKLTPEKGYILTGPSRTGKSYLAEALAGEIKEMYIRQGKNPDDFNFFVLTANFVVTEGIDNIIARAKQYAPCILFIDEIDLLGLQRVGGNSELLSKFLSSMSGCLESDPEKVVIMLAATNKPQTLDTALRQPGRFGKEIRFEYPSYHDRKEYLTKKISQLANVQSFDIEKIARETEGQTFEALNSMIRRAFQKGIVKGEILTQKELEKCLDEELRHIITRVAVDVSPKEKELIATHQAGQAVAVMLLDCQEKLAKVTIKPYLAQLREESAWDQYYQNKDTEQKKIIHGKTYTFHPHDIKELHRLEDKIALCKIQLAGYAAETLLLGSCGYSYHPEGAQCALEIAKSIVSEGVNFQQLTDDLKTNFLKQALDLKKQYAREIHDLLSKHTDKIKALADALLQKETLSGQEAAQIVGLPYQDIPTKSVSQLLAQEFGIKEQKK